ncbi:hypothetical protein [uncultured Microbacterium sp.]|uniref:hypothetical protein n=1 Tax=uncultured Microbacterium sp. TaxID=191216 RepID=UPI0035CA5F28
MRVELDSVSKGRDERVLPETSLIYETGRAVLVCAETEQRPTVLGLIAAGRMRPDSGSVRIDGRADAGALRRAVALVDALDVSEPEPNVSVAGVVAEELMFAGLASHPIAARRWLDGHGLGSIASTPIGNVAPAERIRILCELAAQRPGVAGLVLTSPDRHGGEPTVWWEICEEFAGRGLAVLVIAGRASESVLAASAPAEPDVEMRTIGREEDAATTSILLTTDPPQLRDEPEGEAPETEPAAEPEPTASESRRIAPPSEDSGEILRRSDDPPTNEPDEPPAQEREDPEYPADPEDPAAAEQEGQPS